MARDEIVYEIEDISTHAWSASGRLRTPDFSQSPVKRNTNGFTLNATFPKGGHYTLQFNVEYPSTEANLHAAVRAVAELSWGAEGNQLPRKMHVMNGSCVSGIGQTLSVKVYDDSILGEHAVDPFPVPFEYFVSMAIVGGIRAGQAQPLYLPESCLQRTINAGQIDSHDIPQGAGIDELYIQTRGLNMAIDGVNFKIHSEPLICEFDGQSCNHWTPLVPGSRRIVLHNDTNNDVKYSLLYGIEG